MEPERRRPGHQPRTKGVGHLTAGTQGGSGAEGGPARTLDGAEDSALIAEADLALGGMHVDIEGLRRHVDAHDAIPMTPARDEPAIRLVDGGEQRPVVHAASIDDEDQPGA